MDNLAAFLSIIDSDNEYQVEEVLKESPYEKTERVVRVLSDGSVEGPFIRKYIALDSGLGRAYQTIASRQEEGYEFSCVPHIVACYTLKDALVVVMEYIQGETLQEVSCRIGASLELAKDVFPRICGAVCELHEKFSPPLIHRDLKPTNIMLSWEKVTLIDFGIARVYRSEAQTDTTHFGTREYAPPEQFGFGQTDERSDVYSLGMLLFYCCAGRDATLKDRDANFAHAQIPCKVQQVIKRACAFDPKDRFASVAELQHAFCEATQHAVADNCSKKTGQEHALDSKILGGIGAKVSSWFVAIPLGVGIAWNVVLALLWVFVIACCCVSCFAPAATLPEAAYPLWFRVVEYFLFFGVSTTSICYALSDRRLLRRKFAALRRIPLVGEFIILVVIVPFVLAIVMTIAAQFAV